MSCASVVDSGFYNTTVLQPQCATEERVRCRKVHSCVSRALGLRGRVTGWASGPASASAWSQPAGVVLVAAALPRGEPPMPHPEEPPGRQTGRQEHPTARHRAAHARCAVAPDAAADEVDVDVAVVGGLKAQALRAASAAWRNKEPRDFTFLPQRCSMGLKFGRNSAE